jgi:transcriptional regulator with XRE-family HTH domain
MTRIYTTANLGRLARQHRRALKLTQQQVADLASTHRATISKFEHGKAIKLDIALIVTHTLGIDLEVKAREG